MQAHSHAQEVVEAFLPHGFCYLWNPQLLWTHVVADLLIGLAYVAISTTLVYLVWKGRREFPFQGMFVAFGLFIGACGATHFVEVYTLWDPVYWFSAGVKVVTAVASVGTALLLPPLVPRVLHTVREAKLSEDRRVRAESAEQFHVMTEAMPQIVWTAGPDGAADYYNRRWYEHTGVPRGTTDGWGWQSVVHPEDLERTLAAWTRSVETGEPYETTLRLRSSDGDYRWILARAVPVRDAAGHVLRWIGSATDVETQKRTEEELRAAKEEAERANRAKSEFLSVMSHELRTPLNAIGGFVDLVEMGVHGPVTAAQAQALGRVRQNQGHLLGLINDILHYAKIEAGHLELVLGPVRVIELFGDTAALLEPQIGAAGLECVITCDPALTVRADRDRVTQILLNLISNAVKFTPEEGRIEVVGEEAGGWASIRVRDTGRGIPVEMVQRIFDPFVQVRDGGGRDSSRQGVGLGLAISQELARSMGGDLSVESTLGHGSTFTLLLPRWSWSSDEGDRSSFEERPAASEGDAAIPA